MKKTLCIILACVMLLSCLPLVSLAAGESFIDTKNKRFALKDAPDGSLTV